MSPQVRLVCYPSSDLAFAEHAAMHVTVHVPSAVSVHDMVGAVQEKLRERHPSVVILVRDDGEGDHVVWHVYRDGTPPGSTDGRPRRARVSDPGPANSRDVPQRDGDGADGADVGGATPGVDGP